MVKRHKKEVLTSVFAYAKFVKSYSKVRVISVIYGRLVHNIKQSTFAKLARYQLKNAVKPVFYREVRDLKVQLQDMTVQL
jgi:hypothetical protein